MIRRAFLGSLAYSIFIGIKSFAGAAKLLKQERYKVAVIDLMILKRQKISAIPLAREIGADGLEIDMGGLGDRPTFDNKLSDPIIQDQYLAKAREMNLSFCSLAMTGFYAQSFAKREEVVKMVADCILTMKAMNIKTAFLPLGVQGDLVKNPELRPLIVERLRQIAPMAEKAGVVIGIETALDARSEVKLLEEVGSKAIQIYFNFSNPLEEGRDLCEELRILGKNRICQIHCTDKDGVWLENNRRLDMTKVKRTLDRMGWKGWLVVERSRDASRPKDVLGNFSANVAYMKSIFQ
ncbi:sugar phosphate isomerase/epimerase family protein [Dyadobacter tibetensis]|uniref:sugar phosphate isomerase/epimerase family protein n=1 Tax=Dyadobacter tibetensis TaxID=1211851 RepID=UPI0004712291|nr:sugar phosphate isomerase/epimerase family protein [Dyadobacter tibetensis]